MRFHKFLVAAFFLFVQLSLQAQEINRLQRSTPEAEGISSKAILNFINAVNNSKNELHSFILLRHGKVVAETWWKPYAPELKHTLYSTSKSFTSTAIGFLVTEKKITVEDKVISFFPEFLPDSISPFLSQMKIKDLLSMSTGQYPEPTTPVLSNFSENNWVKGFLRFPVTYEPGTKFNYNSLATYMLSAIVQKVTGEKLIDYLTPRLFTPLGIHGMDWEIDPMNRNTGGWGLRLRTEDMAKFGQLLLQKGKWNEKQIIPSSWIEEATTKKIEQMPGVPATDSNKMSSDWAQGYCYQFWRCRNNAFRADGAFGQYILVMPEQDAVVAITCETSNMQDELNLVWKYLLPAFQTNALPADLKLYKQLKATLALQSLQPLPVSAKSSMEKTIAGKEYVLESPKNSIRSVSFSFDKTQCVLTTKYDTSTYKFHFGSGKWITGETEKPGPGLLAAAKNSSAGLAPFKTAGSYNWISTDSLQLKLRYIESPHTETFLVVFDGENISVTMTPSNNTQMAMKRKGKIKH